MNVRSKKQDRELVSLLYFLHSCFTIKDRLRAIKSRQDQKKEYKDPEQIEFIDYRIGNIRKFIDKNFDIDGKRIIITGNDVKNYFKWSDQGYQIKKEITLWERIKYVFTKQLPKIEDTIGFQALCNAKEWRLRHCGGKRDKEDGMWEQMINEGTTTYYELLKDMPEEVMFFMARTMFCGRDREFIERIWRKENKCHHFTSNN